MHIHDYLILSAEYTQYTVGKVSSKFCL